MEQLPVEMKVFLLYAIIDIGLLMIGGLRMTVKVFEHPLARKENPSEKETDEFVAWLMPVIEEKFFFPHHVWLMKMQMKRTFEDMKERIKKARK